MGELTSISTKPPTCPSRSRRLPLASLLAEITKHLVAQRAAGKREDMVHMACTINAKADFFQLMPKHEETHLTIKQWLTSFFDLPSSTHDSRALGEEPIAPLAYSPAS